MTPGPRGILPRREQAIAMDDVRRVAAELDDARTASLERYARLVANPPELIGTLDGRHVVADGTLEVHLQAGRRYLLRATWPVLA